MHTTVLDLPMQINLLIDFPRCIDQITKRIFSTVQITPLKLKIENLITIDQ